MAILKDIFEIMEDMAPILLAEEWDNVGLQVGNPDDEARGVMVALDPSPEAVEEASGLGCNLLLTHHPLFISGITYIDTGSCLGGTIKSAIEKGVTIFAAHTNLDSAKGGINDILSDILDIEDAVPIESHSEMQSGGLGRIGALPGKTLLKDMVNTVKEKLGAETIRVLGDMDREVERVALCGGSGGNLIEPASKMGADLFISGDIRYHQARRAQELGIAVIDAGHFSTEKIATGVLAGNLEEKLARRGINVPVREFRREKEPFSVF